jgi:hypothetical protein
MGFGMLMVIQAGWSGPRAEPEVTEPEATERLLLLEAGGLFEPAGTVTSLRRWVAPTLPGVSSRVGEESWSGSALEDRLSLGLRESYGSDLLDGRRVVTGRHLTGRANWQREADFRYKVLEDHGSVSLDLTGGFSDGRRPRRLGRQQLRLGKVEAWNEHRGADIGADLRLFDDRLRYEGGYALSDFANQWDDREAARDAGQGPGSRPFNAVGHASRHRLSVAPITHGPLTLSGYGLYQRGDATYRLARRSGARRGFSAGELREVGASLRLQEFRLDVKQRGRSSRGTDQQRLEGRFRYGPLKLSLFRDERSRGRGGDWLTHDDTIGGSVEVDLDQHRHGDVVDGFSMRRLLPSVVKFGMDHGSRQHVQSPRDPPDLSTTQRLGFSWEWDRADTDLSVYRRLYDSRRTGAETADETEYGVDISHSFYGDGWDLFGYVSAGNFAYHEVGSRMDDLWISGGLSLWLNHDDLPNMSLALDYNSYDSTMPDFGERYGQRSLSLEFGVDLSQYLTIGDPSHAPSMNLYYYTIGTENNGTHLKNRKLEHAVAFTMTLRF